MMNVRQRCWCVLMLCAAMCGLIACGGTADVAPAPSNVSSSNVSSSAVTSSSAAVDDSPQPPLSEDEAKEAADGAGDEAPGDTSTNPQRRNLISPGRGTGMAELGATRAAIHRVFGNPAETYSVTANVTGEVWTSKNGKQLRIFYSAGRAVQISVESPQFATPDGLTTQSSLDDVRARYKNLKKSEYFRNGGGGGVSIDYYDDAARGIAFAFVADTLAAIIVHQPNRGVIPDAGESAELRQEREKNGVQ